MQSFLKWSVRHPFAFWMGCAVLGAMLIAMQSRVDGKHFALLPLPSRNPSMWISSIGILFRVFPWMMTGLFVVPLCAVLIAVIARR